MNPVHGFLLSAQFMSHRFRAYVFVLRVLSLLSFVLFALCLAHAQSRAALVPVVTDESIAGNLSNQFGVPVAQDVDQAGDLVFIGRGGSALFFRGAGAASSTIRLLQTGDEVPGFPGSQVILFPPRVSISSSGKIVFAVAYSLPDTLPHQALVTYDGAAYHTIVSSDDPAPADAGKYGTSLVPLSVSAVNDDGDVAFTAAPTSTALSTLYIAPSGGTPLRIVAAHDPLPSPYNSFFLNISFSSGIDSLGEVLFTGRTSQGFGLFLATVSNGGQVLKVLFAGDSVCGGGGIVSTITPTPNATLSNSGSYAFAEQSGGIGGQSTICVGAGGGVPTQAIASGTAAPAAIGGTLNIQTSSPLVIDSSGDIVFPSSITGSSVTTAALLRLHQSSGQLDVVAYDGQSAPGTSGAAFTNSFLEFSVSSGGTVGFVASSTANGTGLYRQSGTDAPVAVAVSGQSAPVAGGGKITAPAGSKILDDGSLFFTSIVSGGGTFYGQFLASSGNIRQLMSTADDLPPGSQVSLLYGSPQASGDFVAFGAQRAGGKLSLFASNTATGGTVLAVTDGDIFPGTGGVVFGPGTNYFLSANGQIAFTSSLVGGSSSSAILASSTTGGLSKVAAVGDSAPIFGTTFTTVTLNSGPPSPVNSAGQVAFSGTYNGASSGSGVFLYSPASGGSVTKVAAIGDPVALPPGTGNISSFADTSSFTDVALNPSGAVAFGASIADRPGYFVGSGGSISKIVLANDTTSIGSISFIGYLSGFNDNGLLTFTGAVFGSPIGGGWSVFTGLAGATPVAAAYSGQSTPDGGLLILSTTTRVGNVTVISTSNYPLGNSENDLAIRGFVAGGTTNSGIFLVDGTGPQIGILRAGISQGAPVPGGSDLALSAITPSTNFALGPSGQIATVANYGPNSSVTNQGMFVRRHDGILVRVLGAGDTVISGGVLSGIRMSQDLAAGGEGRFAFWAGTHGGSIHQAILSTTPFTAVTLGSSRNPSIVGLTVTFTATVSSISDQAPTGTVTFFDNSAAIGTQPLNSGGNATLGISILTAGSHAITAQYNGDANFPSSNSAALTEDVLASGTPPTITSAANATFSVGTTSSFTVTATGAPPPAISESGTLPVGVNFNPLTGILSGSPAAETAGTYSITFKASNGAVPDATQQFKLTVNQTSGAWAGSAGSLTRLRAEHTATLLNSGKVLLAGGVPTGLSPSAELYNPDTGIFASTGSMISERFGHTATLLNNGKVLIVGGNDGSNDLATAELYDPVAGTFTSTGSMANARSEHTATLLANGTVLIAGGLFHSFSTATAEVYDPAAGTFTPTGSLGVARGAHTATRLNNGKVLIIGGAKDSSTYPAASELYDPTTRTFTLSGSLITPRSSHTATLMNNDKILVRGGFNGSFGFLASPELYDVASGTFTSVNSTTSPVVNHTATLLNNGTVLIAGGFDGTNSLAGVEIYDPFSGIFTSTGSMTSRRDLHTATLLKDGKVLVTAGENVVNHAVFYLASAELYSPDTLTPPGLVSIAVAPQNPSIPSGAAQNFVATGTFADNSTRQLASVAWSSSNNSIATVTNDLTNRGAAFVLGSSGSATITACAGSICGSVFLSVSPAPNITSTTHTTFTVGTPGAFVVTAAGTPAPTFSESGALPSGVKLDSTGLLSGVPAAGTGGIYAITIMAHNGVPPDASQSFTLTVNESPKFTSASTGLFTSGSNGSFTVVAIGFPPPALSRSGPLPQGVVFNASTHVLSGSPVFGPGGVYPITFTAQNGVLPDASQNFRLTVNHAPSITSSSFTAFTIGAAGSFTVTASGVPASTFSVIGTLPNGVSFNELAGVLSVTPAAGPSGDYPITITAQNGVLPDAAQNFTLRVTHWIPTGNLTGVRNFHTSTLLNNGKILITGGATDNSSSVVARAELYDPATGTFTATGSLAIARQFHTATLLNDGKVLIAGGTDGSDGLTSAELYDPATGSFTVTGSMAIPRYFHMATLLKSGKVLVTGGRANTGSSTSASAEIYDPSTGKFTVTGAMTNVREGHAAAQLNDGRVLITGGFTGSVPGPSSSAELYDPDTGEFTATGTMVSPRSGHTAIVLNDGKALIVAGSTAVTSLNSAELYDPLTGIFTATGSLNYGRGQNTVTLLSNGNVLVAGGHGSVAGSGSTAELYDPSTGTFTLTDGMTTSRFEHTATLLSSGKVLVAGGCCQLSSAELYPPSTLEPPGLVSIAVTPASPVILVGSSVNLIATGTFSDNSTEQLSSVIWSSSENAAVSVTNDSTNRGVAYAVAPTQTASITACAGSICGSTPIEAGIAPVITSLDSAAFTVSTLGSFTVTATGAPIPTLSESGALPAGMTFDTSTGLLTGIPDAGSEGTYNPTFTAHSGVSSDAVQNFTLSVVRPPVISSFTAGVDTIVSGGSTTLTPVFSDGTGFIDNGVGTVPSGAAETVAPAFTTTYTLTVTNLAGTSVTATIEVKVNNPVPAITSLGPSHADAGAAISALTVNGADFVSGAVVNFNGKAEATTFVSMTQITASVPAADNSVGGSLQVTVTNPLPGGGTSAGQTFTADSFSTSIPSDTATVSAGHPAQFTITIAPTANGFSDTVTLGATGLPQGAAATFSQNPVTAGSTVTMRVTTTGHSSLVPYPRIPLRPLRSSHAMKIATILIAVAVLIFVRQRRRCIGAIPAGALLLCLCLVYGCAANGGSTTPGGGSGGTPAGTYHITVTANSGTLAQTTQVTLIVN